MGYMFACFFLYARGARIVAMSENRAGYIYR
jgi:hypothetical protein